MYKIKLLDFTYTLPLVPLGPGSSLSFVFHMLTNADSTTVPHKFPSHLVPFSRMSVALSMPLFWADIFGLIFVITYADPFVHIG